MDTNSIQKELYLECQKDGSSSAEIVRDLFRRGATPDWYYDKRLMFTIRDVPKDVISAFIDAGMDLQHPDYDYGTLLDRVLINRCTDTEEIIRMVFDKFPSININKPYGPSLKTSLHWAAQCESIDIIKILLEFGADSSVKDRDGCTPRDYLPTKSRDEFDKLIQEMQLR